MAAADVPTAALLDAPRAPCVLKADGLAAGKGVVVCRTDAELAAGIEVARGFGDDVLVEELLVGPEVSILALCDGTNAVVLAPSRDFKRAYDGDNGPNTGGMGSFAPVPDFDRGSLDEVVETCLRPRPRRAGPTRRALHRDALRRADAHEEQPRVLEYNCRFGDPETQSVLPLVDGDLLTALAAAASGSVGGVALGRVAGAAVTVVLVAGDYPSAGDRGTAIDGIAEAEAAGALIFHAGTALNNRETRDERRARPRRDGDGADARRRQGGRICRRRPDPDSRRPSARGHRARRRAGRVTPK